MGTFGVILEITGTIAFAVSGSVQALQKNMDLFGTCVMGLITACGGGVMRDLFLGRLPPVVFNQPVFALTSIAVSAALFLPAVRRLLSRKEHAYEMILLIADSFGLGIFTAAGVAAAVQSGYGDRFFFAVFLGTITGVGGGVLRDVLAGNLPYIFMKHIYACASIIGAMLCTALWRWCGQTLSMLICCIAVLTIRLFAARYHWSLPKPNDSALQRKTEKTS